MVQLGLGECGRAAPEAATGPRCGEPVEGAFDDELTVVLGHGCEDVEDEPPAWGGGVDALFEDDEVDSFVLEAADEVEEVLVAAPDPPEPGHHDLVARHKAGKHLREGGAAGECPGGLVDEDPLLWHTGFPESVELVVRVLLPG